MTMTLPTPVIATIAGSDSGGGAGIQADLHAIRACGGFGVSVVTAVTAQNLSTVSRVHPVPADVVVAQLRAVCEGFPVAAVKTGMLHNAAVVATVARELPVDLPCVVDPVMVATAGHTLLEREAIANYRQLLIPRATLLTPNLPEAAVLLERQSIDDEGQEQAARALAQRFRCPILLKGGHRRGALCDIFADGEVVVRYPAIRRELNAHGTGCILSAAIAAHLGRGVPLKRAVVLGLEFLAAALADPVVLQNGERLAAIGPVLRC